jgi:hypothetical protein
MKLILTLISSDFVRSVIGACRFLEIYYRLNSRTSCCPLDRLAFPLFRAGIAEYIIAVNKEEITLVKMSGFEVDQHIIKST